MIAPPVPDIFDRQGGPPQADLPLATEGVLRYVWEGKFGSILIEVRDSIAFVNGQAVEPVERTKALLNCRLEDPM